MKGRDEGFTLVELVVVLAIVGILMTVGMASYRAMTQSSEAKAAQLDLLTAVKVQALHHLEEGTFTDDPATLFDLEPTLRYSADGEPAGTVVVRSEPGRTAIDVCLFARTPTGDWFSIYHSAVDGDRFGRAEPDACFPGIADDWSSGSW